VRWQEPAAGVDHPGIDRARLDALGESLAERGTKAFLVARGERLVHERYERSWRGLIEDPTTRRSSTASMAKAVVGSTALLLALGDGLLRLDDPAARFIPRWAGDPLRSKITVADLATHVSGLSDAATPRPGEVEGPGEAWKAEYRVNPSGRTRLSLEAAPMLSEPGTRLDYANTGYSALAYVLAAALRGRPEPDVAALLRRRVLEPLDLPPSAFSLSYGESAFELDGLRLHEVGGGAAFTPRALARLVRLVARTGGRWEGKPLLDPVTLAAALRPASVPLPPDWRELRQPRPALGWWSNADGAWPSAPPDTLVGAGAGHQLAVAIPSLDLVAVRYGPALGRDHFGGDFWAAFEDRLLAPLVAAVGPA
jgi:CubicO group peptidase (beta-lactamase class C family)